MICKDDFKATENSSDQGKVISYLKQRLDSITQHLCFICGEATEHGLLHSLIKDNQALRNWWVDHQMDETNRVLQLMEMYYRPGVTAEELSEHFLKEAKKSYAVSSYHVSWFLRVANMLVQEEENKQNKRIKQKEMRNQALAKLSPEERKALGF